MPDTPKTSADQQDTDEAEEAAFMAAELIVPPLTEAEEAERAHVKDLLAERAETRKRRGLICPIFGQENLTG